MDVTEFGLGDELAAAWERNRDRMFESVRPVSEWIVNDVDPQPGETILELTAGPGETGFLAATRVGSEGRLICSDLSPGMVAAARRGAEARELSNVDASLGPILEPFRRAGSYQIPYHAIAAGGSSHTAPPS